MSEFEGKVVLVTGAAGALGRAVVEHFAGQGATIAQLDVVQLDNAHYSATADLTDADACRSAVTAVCRELGPIQVLANIAGNARLSALMTVGTIDAIFTAIVLVVVGGVLRAMMRVVLLSNAARHLGIAPEHSDAVRSAFFRTISLVATVLWIVFTLRGFMVYDPLIAKLGAMLAAEASIGEFSISLGNVLIFVFIIWLSIKLAALVDFVLEVIVLRHVTLPVGVPQTISRLSRYTVIVVGVMVAFSAIGFDVSKAALVAGGLGVGRYLHLRQHPGELPWSETSVLPQCQVQVLLDRVTRLLEKASDKGNARRFANAFRPLDCQKRATHCELLPARRRRR